MGRARPDGQPRSTSSATSTRPLAPARKLLLWALALLLLSAAPGFAQSNTDPRTVSRPREKLSKPTGDTPVSIAPEPAALNPNDPQPPSPDLTMEAYRLIRKQLDQWAIVTLPPGTKRSGIASAAAVQIRIDNQLRGRGSFVSLSAGGDDVMTVAHRAATEAYTEADRRLPGDRDALRRETVARLGAAATISLEIAGPTTPLNVQSYQQLERTGLVRPGLDALLAVCNNKAAALLPSQQIIGNLTPAEAARQLVAIVTDNPQLALEDLDKVQTKHGVRLYKAATTHMAEHTLGAALPAASAPGALDAPLQAASPELAASQPVFLTRGARLIPRSELDTEPELLAFADAMAANLIGRIHPGAKPLGLRGTHLPWLGTFVPEVASPIEQALAAHALDRHAALRSFGGSTPGAPADAKAAASAAAAARIWRELEQVDASESPLTGDADAAISILALLPATETEATTRLRDVLTPVAATQPDWGARPGPIQGIAAAAARRALPENQQLQGLRRQLLAATPAEKLAGMMPFLALAELAAHPPARGELPAATRLREMRAFVWANQLTAGPGAPPDLVGGIVFGSASGGFPTWSAAGPLAAIAAMLADERTTAKSERGTEIVRLIEALRFSRGLMIDADSSWCCTTPALAIGAIRAAPFDWRCPPDATSMTLLAVCQTVEALRAMK